jgi:hypothetical protein
MCNGSKDIVFIDEEITDLWEIWLSHGNKGCGSAGDNIAFNIGLAIDATFFAVCQSKDQGATRVGTKGFVIADVRMKPAATVDDNGSRFLTSITGCPSGFGSSVIGQLPVAGGGGRTTTVGRRL